MKTLIFLFCIAFSFTSSAGIIGYTPDTGDEFYFLTDLNGTNDDSALRLVEFTGGFNTSDHEFGLFFVNANGDVTGQLSIFDAMNTSDTSVLFDYGANTVSSALGGTLDLTGSIFNTFGFYFRSDFSTYYTWSDLNSGGTDYFESYNAIDPFNTYDVYLKGVDNGTGDALDTVSVQANDIQGYGQGFTPVPVPEPSTLLIFTLSILAMLNIKKFNLK